jgi:hypothetical protein
LIGEFIANKVFDYLAYAQLAQALYGYFIEGGYSREDAKRTLVNPGTGGFSEKQVDVF